MTTTAAERAAISRQNGSRSRWPTSPTGKCRSRQNALKHGLTARMPLLPGEDQAAFRRQVEGVIEALQPRDAIEVALAEQAALSLWKIERAERAEAARVAAALRAADAGVGLEERDEVAAMGHWLLTDTLLARQNAAKSLLPFLSEDRHDPFERGRGDPRHIVLRLEAGAEGCRWLLGQWARLGERLERGSDWRTNELIMALQLRGQRPLGRDCLEWQGVIEPIPADGDAELIAEVTRRLRLQLEDGLPEDPAGRRAAMLRLVQEETARLDERKAGHERREAADRSELADRLAVDTTAEGERMRRYQLDFDRKLHRALASLLKLRRGEGVGGAGDPAPEGTPEAEPGPVEAVEPGRGSAEGPEGEADALAAVQPKTGGHGPEDEDLLAGGLPSAFLEPASAAIAAPARPAAEPEGHPVPQDEPRPTAGGDPIAPGGGTPAPGGGEGAQPDPHHEPMPRNEPSLATDGEWIPQDDATAPAAGDRIPRNEPSPPAGGDRLSQDGPTGPGRIADWRVPALACALVILLAARLSTALAVPIGEPSIPADGKSGPAALPGRDLRQPAFARPPVERGPDRDDRPGPRRLCRAGGCAGRRPGAAGGAVIGPVGADGRLAALRRRAIRERPHVALAGPGRVVDERAGPGGGSWPRFP